MNKEKKPKEKPLKINTSLDDVLKASVPKNEKKETTKNNKDS